MKIKKTILITSLSVFSLTAVFISSFSYDQYLRVLPQGTYLQDIHLGGLTRPQTLGIVNERINKLVQIRYRISLINGTIQEFSTRELGINYEAGTTVKHIFNSTGWYARFTTDAAQFQNSFIPEISFDQNKMEDTLKKFFILAEKDPQDAEIVWNENNWFIRAEESGLILKSGEMERITNEIKQSSVTQSSAESIEVAYELVEPSRKIAELEPLLDAIKDKVTKPVSVNFLQEKIDINLEENKDWLVLDQKEFNLEMNEVFAMEWIKNYAMARDVAPGQVLVTAVEEHISEYDKKPYKKSIYSGDFTHGKKIIQTKIIDALKNIFNDPQLERKIIVEWETLLPSVSSQVPGYDFPQILSTGISSFRYGNHPNRVKNIKLSLGTFQGVIVSPGEEFSFNRVTGWITPNKGYTKTQVIMEGKVEEGVGGGVCQSSTTMYRSILNAGVKVTERRNHTLDVVYYHEFGYGLDATVYTDSRNDLKFVNNFSSPILINTYTDDLRKEAYVEFYGTTDNRVVELTQINTGDYLLKKWNWKIIWPDRFEEYLIQSRYQVPKEEEKPNPLEA